MNWNDMLQNTVGSVAGSVASGAGYWIDKATGASKGRANDQIEQQKRLTEIQENANARASRNSLELQKEMIDYTNPSMTMKRLEDAGLNPALMYGTGGAGGSTTGSATQQGVSGANASDESSRKSNNIQDAVLGAQLGMMQSQIDKNIADANKANADANKTKGVDTDNVKVDIAKKKSETISINIANEIAEATKETVIDTAKQGLMKLEEETNSIINNNEIVEASKADLIKLNSNNAINSGLDALVKKGQLKINEQQLYVMKAEIKKMNAEVDALNTNASVNVANYKRMLLKDKYDVLQKYDEIKINTLAKVMGVNADIVKSALNSLSNLTGAGLIGFGARGLSTSVTTSQTTRKPIYNTDTGQVEYRDVTTRTTDNR